MQNTKQYAKEAYMYINFILKLNEVDVLILSKTLVYKIQDMSFILKKINKHILVPGFGNEEVRALFSHFSDRLDTEADVHKMLREWAHLQVRMYTRYTEYIQ